MNFVITKELGDYLIAKNKKSIVVEVINSDSSDFSITELHIFAANEKTSDFYQKSKHYTSIDTSFGEVLLPPYKLDYEEEIEFSLKRWLFIKWIVQKGITL